MIKQLAALTFLELNGVTVDAEADELVELVERVARGAMHKSGIAEFFRRHAT